jgi:RNA binding exosome subunit
VRALAGEEAELSETRSRGYHKQSLRIVEAEVRRARDIRELLGRLGTDSVVADYVRTWELRLDAEEGMVHFRLAKQPLLEGRVELEAEDGAGDLVKVELKLLAYPAKPESYRTVAEGLFGPRTPITSTWTPQP